MAEAEDTAFLLKFSVFSVASVVNWRTDYGFLLN